MSMRAEIAGVLVSVFCLGHVTQAGTDFRTVYSDDFRDHYPRSGQKLDLSRYELETPTVIWESPGGRKITLQRTRGDKYEYEQQRCVLRVEGGGLKRARFLSVVGFRDVEASWITGKLIAIRLDIGHVAGVDAVYDVEADKLIYCESVTYILESEGGANGIPRTGSRTNRISSAVGARR